MKPFMLCLLGTAAIMIGMSACGNPASSPVAVTGIRFEKPSAAVLVGGTISLKTNFIPGNATKTGVTWSSSDTNIATVSASGVVSGIAAGHATITVTSDDGGKTDTCNVGVGKLSGTITLPASVSGKTYALYIDYDTMYTNGQIALQTGTVTGNTIDYTFASALDGTYYVYAIVWVASANGTSPGAGDYWGCFPNGDAPSRVQVTVSNSAATNADFPLIIQ